MGSSLRKFASEHSPCSQVAVSINVPYQPVN